MIKALHIEPKLARDRILPSLFDKEESPAVSLEFSDDLEEGLKRAIELDFRLLLLDEGLADGVLDKVVQNRAPLEEIVRVYAFSNASRWIERQRQRRRALRQAIDGRELFLDYQPQFDLRSGDLVGVEALVRWRRADGRVIAPGDFVSVAEDVGLMPDLGEWVIEEACRQSRRWLDAGCKWLPVAVNVSPRQLAVPTFSAYVEEQLVRFDLPASLLDLELTENVDLSRGSGVHMSIRQLGDLGVRLSIDDFGTGYASFEYVRSLPVHRLKIAREFIQRVALGGRDAAIVTAIIGLGRELGIKVLAEGIENKDQLGFLLSRECDEAQGYLLGTPHPAEALTEWIRPH